ncbi:hypothetical protein Tco_0666280 [Tanacetum coccineum]
MIPRTKIKLVPPSLWVPPVGIILEDVLELLVSVLNGARGFGVAYTLGMIPHTCSSVADWLRISSGCYAAVGIYSWKITPLGTLVDEEEGGGIQTPSTNATLVVAKITELERQMLNEKLVLVDEHGNPLKRKVMNEASASKLSTSMGDQLEEFDYDEVELPDDKTSRYMTRLLDICL